MSHDSHVVLVSASSDALALAFAEILDGSAVAGRAAADPGQVRAIAVGPDDPASPARLAEADESVVGLVHVAGPVVAPGATWAAHVAAVGALLDQLGEARATVTTLAGLAAEPQQEWQRVCAVLSTGWHPVSSRAVLAAIENIHDTASGHPAEQLSGDQPHDELAVRAPEVVSSLAPTTAPGSLSARDNRMAELLDMLGSSLLVSTYQSNRVVALRPTPTGLSVHLRAFDRPMGIALTPHGLSLATRSEIIDFRNLAAAAATLEPAGTHDACLLPRRVHITGDIAAHDLGLGRDGLWVVATKFSCLATLDDTHSFVPQWQPPFITELAAEDRCHLNGMALVDGRPRYVTALGTSNEAGGWRADKADGGVVMSVPNGTIVASGLSMPHSPRWHEGTLYLLDSGRGRLVSCDPSTGELTTIAELPGFTRGLSLHRNVAFVATSQIRETATFGGLPVAEKGPLTCGVWAIDLETGEVMASVTFEDRIQELFDVAFLPGVRHPEIGEPGAELVQTSWEVPAPR